MPEVPGDEPPPPPEVPAANAPPVEPPVAEVPAANAPPQVVLLDDAPVGPAPTPYGPLSGVSTIVSIETKREWARVTIALILLALLSAIALIAAVGRVRGDIGPSAFKDIMTGLFTPIIGLVGAVTGFYFGGK